MLCVEHSCKFLESYDEIDETSHGSSRRFEFFSRAGAYKHYPRVRVIYLYRTRRCNHRRELFRNSFGKVGELLFDKHRPRRAAACEKEGDFARRHFLYIVVSFRDTADVCADSDFENVFKAER